MITHEEKLILADRNHYTCDWCEARLTEEIEITHDNGTKEIVTVFIQTIVNNQHLSLGIASFCGKKCSDKYWKTRELYMPMERRKKLQEERKKNGEK